MIDAPIVSVRNSASGDGTRIMTVYCRYCGETHAHRGDERVARDARCGGGQYMPGEWKRPR